VLVAGALVAALPLAGGAAEAAVPGPLVLSLQLDPTQLVVGTHPATLTAVVVVQNAPTVTLSAQPMNAATPVKDFTGTANGDTWTFNGTFNPTDPAGSWLLTVTAAGDGKTATFKVGMAVLQAGRFFGFDARPRLARKGHQIYFSGRLGHTVNGKWQWLANASVNILFRQQGSTPNAAPLVVKTVTTDGRGRLFAHTPATTSGRYSAALDDHEVDRLFVATAESHRVFVKVLKGHHWGVLR